MKLALMISLFFLGLMLSACRVHTIVDMDNPEFPRELRPTDLSGELLEKYSVGDVIVEPQIRHASVQEQYKLAVLFASKSNTALVSVNKISVLVNGKEFPCGKGVVDNQGSEWKLYPENKPFYVCSIISSVLIEPPKVEMTKARVDVSLVVSVKDESGNVTEKKINAYFIPRKRRYLE